MIRSQAPSTHPKAGHRPCAFSDNGVRPAIADRTTARKDGRVTDPTPLCVLGLGLIGGSLLRAAAGTRQVSGWSPGAGTRESARQAGFQVHEDLDTALSTTAEREGLVVLAAPLTAFAELLRRVHAVAPGVMLTDVGSVKAPVAAQVADCAPAVRFIGSHPMAGTQFSGWAAGRGDLFDGAAWVTCLTEDSDLPTWRVVAELALAMGSRVVPADAEAHDDAVARISHLPHLLALALAQVGAEGGSLALSLAASSFADGTRVAATRPELIRAMCETNRHALIGALNEALGILGVARASLASSGSLAKITEFGHAAREQFEARGGDLEEAELTGTDLVEQLLSVGASGGYVSAVLPGTPLTVRAHFPLT